MGRILYSIFITCLSFQIITGQNHIHWGSTNDPNNGLTITWHSTDTSDQIKWGYTTSYEQGLFSGVSRDDYSGYLLDYTFPSVAPSSLIHYSISSNGVWSPDRTFETSVGPNSVNYSFIAGGDSRTNMDDWETSANWLANESVDFHLFLGDHVWSGFVTTDWDNWYARGVTFLEKNIIYHTGGNHEFGPIFLNQFVMPGNEKWYSFEFGNALFICLLSEQEYMTQHTWLVNELSTSLKTWKVVFFHKPFFTTGDHANDMNSYLETWWKAFDDYGVDVVLGGHTHYYLRSKPINLNVSSAFAVAKYGSSVGQGRLQIVSGSYGAPRTDIGNGWYIEENVSAMNYTKFEINDNTLLMRAYDMFGSLIDSVAIVKSDISVPVELSSFTSQQKGNDVLLEWETESELNNLGFIICKKSANYSFAEIASYLTHPELEGQGSTNKRTQYSYIDKQILSGIEYDYQLTNIDYSGSMKLHKTITVVVNEPQSCSISSYPNPFNSTTQLNYELRQESQVKLVVLDLLGKEVITLVNQIQDAGNMSVTWNGRDTFGSPVSTGIYFYLLRMENFVHVGKMVHLK